MNIIVILFTVTLVMSICQMILAMRYTVNDSGSAFRISNIIRKYAKRYLLYQSIASMMFSLLVTLVTSIIKAKFNAFIFVGSASCVLATAFNLNVATLFNIRCMKEAEKHSISSAFRRALEPGVISSLFSFSLAVLTFMLAQSYSSSMYLIVGYASAALIIRIMGGVFTKSADVGTDLVGKIEQHIPEDDVKNPGTIADNIGDNVGDCCGTSSASIVTYVSTMGFVSLFGNFEMPAILICLFSGLSVTSLVSGIFMDSFSAVLIGMIPSFVLNLFVMLSSSTIYQIIPVIVCNLLLIIGSLIVDKIQKENDSAKTELRFKNLLPVACIMYLIQIYCIPVFKDINHLYAMCIGVVSISIVQSKFIEYLTSADYGNVQKAMKFSSFGFGMTYIAGISLSNWVIYGIIILIGIMLFNPFFIVTFKDFVMANAIGLSALMPTVLSQDCFGAVTDNAGGIAEMSGAGKQVRDVTDKLDMIGNTIKSITKGYTTIAALFTFGHFIINIVNPIKISESLFSSLFSIGTSYGVSALVFWGIQSGALAVAREIRHQFMTVPGLLEGKSNPDYEAVIKIATKKSVKCTVNIVVLLILTLIFYAFMKSSVNILMVEAIGLMTIIVRSLDFNILGGIFDNMKKGREIAGIPKQSDQYSILVGVDAVGDYMKDGVGPITLQVGVLQILLVYLLLA